ncbi:hypothetical protein EJ110_NYTH23994 [Nymphaea thermarum]|nr:hypothetical protein EJ110_NYTH23994 [Nymphaea thermarum]
MDRLGVRNKRANKKPIKVVYIANPKMVKASAADFRALVQELTGNIGSSGRTITSSPPPISSPDENNMIRPSQVDEIISPGAVVYPVAETIGCDERPLSVDYRCFPTELSLEDLILQQIMLEGEHVAKCLEYGVVV